jgi:hypothetical protein
MAMGNINNSIYRSVYPGVYISLTTGVAKATLTGKGDFSFGTTFSTDILCIPQGWVSAGEHLLY